MDALIFAAGKGERMRPLTETTPKPLLAAGGKPLIVWHLEKLAGIGVRRVVINTSWLAECFAPALGNGARWGLELVYSYEGTEPLETGGGMAKAIPLLDGGPFLAISGDVFCDADFARLPPAPCGLAHLLMVDNPVHHPSGDFALLTNGQLASEGAAQLTFSGIGVYRPELLLACQASGHPARFKLAPVLRAAMAEGKISGEHHHGQWTDVGTPERLAELDRTLRLSP